MKNYLILLITLILSFNSFAGGSDSYTPFEAEQVQLCVDEVELQYNTDGVLDGVTSEEYEEMLAECFDLSNYIL